jgi:hypothetical protein
MSNKKTVTTMGLPSETYAAASKIIDEILEDGGTITSTSPIYQDAANQGFHSIDIEYTMPETPVEAAEPEAPAPTAATEPVETPAVETAEEATEPEVPEVEESVSQPPPGSYA